MLIKLCIKKIYTDTANKICLSALLVSLLAVPEQASALEEIVLKDIHGRRLNEQGLVVVDWEGQIANPAIRLFVHPPKDGTFPGNCTISSTQKRLYFDLPSQVSSSGPSKILSFSNTNPLSFYVSIFGDRDSLNENYPLTLSFTDANGSTKTQNLKVNVIDQDKVQTNPFSISVDFSKDTTGFFSTNMDHRNIFNSAAQDWAYFFDYMSLDPVSQGIEQTWIWNASGFTSGYYTANSFSYSGYLLYAYGINVSSPPYRSGGEPSLAGGFLSSNGVSLPLKRSGGVEIEIKGNYNTLGWFLTSSDDDWWQTGNYGNEKNDLYSIAHHEIGHALIFNPAQTRFSLYKTLGKNNDTNIISYHGTNVSIDSYDHLGGSIDRISKRGAYGNEYYGNMPARRWQITKLDLLVAQSIGYKLRDTSPFKNLQITTTGLPRGGIGGFYSQNININGGVPSYYVFIKNGSLPQGIGLDSFSGQLSGTPKSVGDYNFTVEVRDSDEASLSVTREFNIKITSTPLRIESIENNGANITVKYYTIGGYTYNVERSVDLINWTGVDLNVQGTGVLTSTVDLGRGSAPKNFYRLIEIK